MFREKQNSRTHFSTKKLIFFLDLETVTSDRVIETGNATETVTVIGTVTGTAIETEIETVIVIGSVTETAIEIVNAKGIKTGIVNLIVTKNLNVKRNATEIGTLSAKEILNEIKIRREKRTASQNVKNVVGLDPGASRLQVRDTSTRKVKKRKGRRIEKQPKRTSEA